MEDAHVAVLDLPAPETDSSSKIRLFGVFDGHGGGYCTRSGGIF